MGWTRADVASLEHARAMAEVEGRYDAAVTAYRAEVEATGSAAVAAELAALYERLGEIDAAVELYELAVARHTGETPVPHHTGYNPVPQAKRLQSQLEHCKRQRASLVRFPVSVEAETDIRQVNALLTARQWGAAFSTIDSILERFNGTFRQAGPGQYQGIWQWARQTLDAMPEAGQTAYREWLQKRWQACIEDGSVGAYRAFVERNPGAVAMSLAMTAWAETLADQGRARRARGLTERLGSQKAGESEAVAGSDVVYGDKRFVYEGSEVWAYRAGESSVSHPADPEVGRYGGETPGPHALWQYRPREPADRIDVRRELHARDRFPRERWAGAFDRPAMMVCPAGVVVGERYHRGEPDHVYSVLTCLHAGTGRPRWSMTGDPLMDRLGVRGEPVYAAGKILVVMSGRGDYPEYWVFALDADDGHVIWRRRIAVGASPVRCLGAGMLHAGQSGPTLLYDGEVVYYATHMGAVVALDRDVGQPLWAASYPRLPRFGPLTRGRLPLLERRTEPMRIVGGRLVLMPRDLNGVLVIDRASGRIERTIASLELIELVDASSEHVVVRTLAGELRSYGLADGDRDDSGQPIDDDVDIGVPAVSPMPSLPMIACSPREDATGGDGWSYHGFVPGGASDARLVGTKSGVVLVLVDQRGMSACLPTERYRRLWWRPFDSEHGVWAASRESSGGPGWIAASGDRETVMLIDAATGNALAEGRVEAIMPIREMHVIGDMVIVAGTSTLAGVRPVEGGVESANLDVVWHVKPTEGSLQEVLPTASGVLVFAQPGDVDPARVMRIDPASGKVMASFTLAAPLPERRPFGKKDWPDRYPVRRFSYAQDDLRREGTDYSIDVAHKAYRLHPSAMNLRGFDDGCGFFEMTEYRGVIELETGAVTMVSPFDVGNGPARALPQEEKLATWFGEKPARHPPDPHDPLTAPDFRIDRAPCGQAYLSVHKPCDWLVDDRGAKLRIAGLGPKRIEQVGDWAMVQGVGGTVVLTRGALNAAGGKSPADLFDPQTVEAISPDGLTLDGDVSDWPAEGWYALTPERHLWIESDAAAATVDADYRFALNAATVWLAVRVRDDVHHAPSAAPTALGDEVRVLLTNEVSTSHDGTEPRPWVISMRLADHVPIAYLDVDGEPLRAGLPATLAERFDPWLARRYGESVPTIEGMFVAAERRSGQTVYELRIDRSLFIGGHPTGFDLEVGDDDGEGLIARLEWGGALLDRKTFPIAYLARPK